MAGKHLLVAGMVFLTCAAASAAKGQSPDASYDGATAEVWDGASVVPGLLPLLDALGASDAKQRRATADALVAFVKNDGRPYRSEIARALQRAGDRSVAPLIRASHDPSRDVARWASGVLDTMGKKVPGDAVQTKSNDVLSDVLEAFGATRDADALSAVLPFVNSDRDPIRRAARDAVLTYGDAALAKLREAYANLTGNPSPNAWSSRELASELFALDDRTRLREVYALMDSGLAADASGDHGAAVVAFEKVLARQPLFERRAEMVPAYVALAQSKEETDAAAAGALYRTAARLASDGPRAGQIASALAYLDGESLLARGVTDEAVFRKAAELDPGNARAHAEVARIEAERARRELTVRHYEQTAGGVLGAAFGVALLFAFRRGPRRA